MMTLCERVICTVAAAETGVEKSVKVEQEDVVEVEEAGLEMTTSSDAATGFTTSCDLSQLGDDVVSSTSDVLTCDYEGPHRSYCPSLSNM